LWAALAGGVERYFPRLGAPWGLGFRLLGGLVCDGVANVPEMLGVAPDHARELVIESMGPSAGVDARAGAVFAPGYGDLVAGSAFVAGATEGSPGDLE
jgi:hypothetical protein